MNRSICLLAFSFVAAIAAAAGGEEPPEARVFERTAMAVPQPVVNVAAVSGLVEIQGWSQISVYASGTLGQALEEPVVRRAEASREISLSIDSGNPRVTPGPETDARITVLIPRNASLVVDTTTAEVRISGIRGDVEVRSARGDVTIEGPLRQAVVETFWGDISVIGAVSNSDLMTWEGDIVTTNLQGPAFLRAWNGNMHCAGAQVDQLDVFTAYGSANLEVSLGDSGMLQAVVNGPGDIRKSACAARPPPPCSASGTHRRIQRPWPG